MMCGRWDVVNRRGMMNRRRVMVLRRLLVVMMMPGWLVRRLRGIDEGFGSCDGRQRPVRARRPAPNPPHNGTRKQQRGNDKHAYGNGNDPIHCFSPFPVSTT